MEIRDNRQKEWSWLDNEYLNGYAKLVKPMSTLVYYSLCRHADNKTQTCFPSMKYIAEEYAISEKTVERSIKELEFWNIIHVTRSKKSDGTQANNIYTLLSKNVWKSKPTDSQSVGTDRHLDTQPTDFDDSSRQTHSLYNKTHINNTNITTLSNVANATFLSFWSEYPNRRRDKEKCEVLFSKFPIELQEKIVVDVIERKKEHQDWIKDNNAFVPAPLVYLRNKRWEEDIRKVEKVGYINLNKK